MSTLPYNYYPSRKSPPLLLKKTQAGRKKLREVLKISVYFRLTQATFKTSWFNPIFLVKQFF